MVRGPYFDKNGMKKGEWSEDEDNKLRAYVQKYGHWNWRELPKFAGLSRCGKSCRLRWMNYLRPNIKRGNFTKDEEDLIIRLHKKLGTKWSVMAAELPGRSDNEIKNYWHTHLKKRAQKDQTILLGNKDVKTLASDVFQAKRIGKPLEDQDLRHKLEVESLVAVLSSESLPSPSLSSTELSSATSSAIDGAFSCGDFWTEPFLAEGDSVTSNEFLLSPLELVNGFVSQPAGSDMIMDNEFIWSTMALFSEYDNQFMN